VKNGIDENKFQLALQTLLGFGPLDENNTEANFKQISSKQ
jgi:hypothetical protein